MEVKYKILLSVSWYIGLNAFIGGWTIFLTWLGGRYIGAWDFENFELIGFLWMAGFFWLSIIAIILLLIYVVINRRNLHLKMLLTVIMILVNILAVIIILNLQRDIENKVFVKLYNQTGIDLKEIKLYGNLKTWNIGGINQGSSKVLDYEPPYCIMDARLYQKPDTLNLIITYDKHIDTLGFPTLRMGECRHLVLDENFKIKN